MIVKKNLEIGIDIQDPISIYTDPDSILYIVADRYENRCYAGCFILKVERIMRKGDCVISQIGAKTYGTLPLIIEVTAIVYTIGEVINGCTVTNKDKNGIIVCSSKYADIYIPSAELLRAINTGHMISIRVAGVKYNLGDSKISINAIAFSFTNKPMIFKVGEYDKETEEIIDNTMKRIEYEREQMTELKKKSGKAWETFNQLMYAYKTPQKPPAGAKTYSLLNIVGAKKFPAVYLSRDSRIDLSTDNVYGYDQLPNTPGMILRSDLTSANVMIILLEDYYNYLRTIREMIEIYSTKQLLDSHKVLWQIYKKNKFQ